MQMLPGTIVKFKNLVEKSEYNGRCGVIRKQLLNGQFGVIVDASEIDVSFNETNLQVISTCPNEDRLNIEGVLIWPHVKGVNTPSMQWMDDSRLTKAFENPCDENGAFKGCETDLYTRSWIDEDRERIMKKYEDILIEKLGWNSPQMWMHTTGSLGKIENKVCIYYDEDSVAPLNDWLETRFDFAFNQGILPKIRGSFICVDELDKADWAVGRYTINYRKSIFHALRYFGDVPAAKNGDPVEQDKLYAKYGCRLGKIRAALPGCLKDRCRDCNKTGGLMDWISTPEFAKWIFDPGHTQEEAHVALKKAEQIKLHYDEKGIKAKDALQILRDMLEADDEHPSKTLPLVANKLEMEALILIYENHLKEVPLNQKGEDRKAKREQKRAKTLSKNKKKTNKK